MKKLYNIFLNDYEIKIVKDLSQVIDQIIFYEKRVNKRNNTNRRYSSIHKIKHKDVISIGEYDAKTDMLKFYINDNNSKQLFFIKLELHKTL